MSRRLARNDVGLAELVLPASPHRGNGELSQDDGPVDRRQWLPPWNTLVVEEDFS